jgi:hypothetical protein
MLIIPRTKAMVLSLLAVMLVGSAMAVTASAAVEAGPFWHHRNEPAENTGEKIPPRAPENFKGTGGAQTLQGKVGTMNVKIVSGGVQVKGAIFNNTLQGQIKLEIVYKQPELVEPALKECNVRIGNGQVLNNIVVVKGHLMWKWNGAPAQLTENPAKTGQTPDLAFTNVEPTKQSTLPNYRSVGVFANVNLTGAGCGALAGVNPVGGSEVGLPNLPIETWSRKLAVRTLQSETIPATVGTGEGFLQHFWNGEAMQGMITGLTFAGNPANLIGQTEVESAQQEISIFEK